MQPTVNISFNTNVSGNADMPTITVGSQSCTLPCTLQLNQNTQNVQVTVASPQTFCGAQCRTQYNFTSWDDGAPQNRTINVGTSNASYKVNFSTQFYLATAVSPSGGGSISPAPPGAWYNSGTSASIGATASAGYTFTGYSGCVTGNPQSAACVMNGPQTVTANFGAPGYVITSSPAGLTVQVDGANCTTPCTFSNWSQNSYHTLNATSPAPSNGISYTFSSWSGPGVGTNGTTTSSMIGIQATSPATYTATFNTSYYLTPAVNPSYGGTMILSPGGSPPGWYSSGQSVSISVAANSGYQFTGFSGCGLSGTSIPQNCVMNGPQTVTANFKSLAPFTISIKPFSVGMRMGGTTTFAVTITLRPGAAPQTVNLMPAAGLPAGMTATLSMNSVQLSNAPVTFSVTLNAGTAQASDSMVTISGQQAAAPGMVASSSIPVHLASLDYQTWVDALLLGASNGQVYAHFESYVTGNDSSRFTSQFFGVSVSGPGGVNYQQTTASTKTTGTTKTIVDLPAFAMQENRFGDYQFTYTVQWLLDNQLQDPSSGTYVVPLSYPTPQITSVSPNYAVPGTTTTIMINGSGLGVPSADWPQNPSDSHYTGVTAASLSAPGTSLSIGTLPVPDQATGSSVPVTLTVPPDAISGQYSLTLTVLGHTTSPGTAFSIGDPTPVISMISPSTFQAGTVNVPVTITGSGFGANPSIVIDGSGVTANIDPANPPTDTQISASFDIDPNAGGTVNVSVLSSGTTTHNFAPAQTGQSQQSNSKPVNVTKGCVGCIYLQYRAFIRANWVQSPTGCLAGNDQIPIETPGTTTLYVRGDNRNFQWLPQDTPNPTLPKFPYSPPFRVYQPLTLSPSPGGSWTVTPPHGWQGVSRMYDTGSLVSDTGAVDPAGSGKIINTNIADAPKTCNGTSAQLLEKQSIVPSLNQPTVTVDVDGSVTTSLSGTGRDPNVFGSVAAPIQWNLSVTVSADGSIASITGTHTCFPAHEIYTNGGKVLWQYGPNYGTGQDGVPVSHCRSAESRGQRLEAAQRVSACQSLPVTNDSRAGPGQSEVKRRPTMKFTNGNGTLLCTAVLVTSVVAHLQGESRFVSPFENFRRSHDLGAFGKEMRTALEQPVADLREDIAYLISVCDDKKEEPRLRDSALEELYFIAFQMMQVSAKPVEAFRPASPIFESHLDEALADVNSKWTGMLISLTAFVGLQPSPNVIPLFYRAIDANTKFTDLALMSLARLNPRPAEAKKILLQRAPKFDRDERIEILAFAVDDPDLLAIFAKSLESTDAYEQWRATKYMVHLGESAKPALQILHRLQQRRDLDKDVAANIKKAIDQIEGRK